MTQPVDVLERATRLLVENGVCRGAFAIDANGDNVSAFHETAEKFCILGAIQRAAYESGTPLENWTDTIDQTMSLLRPYFPTGTITGWVDQTANDREVVSVMRSALSAAQSPQIIT